MRVNILCEEARLLEVREKMKNNKILKTPCSESGELPATHYYCCIATTETEAHKMMESAEITTMEISGPKEFLTKWNLKIIK